MDRGGCHERGLVVASVVVVLVVVAVVTVPRVFQSLLNAEIYGKTQ